MSAAADSCFADRLLRWFDAHGRHDLPWQRPRSAYRVWLSEVMLQQTQVATVVPYFERFVARLPALPVLAAADPDIVFSLWSGLGYYSRARNLHRAARICMERHGGELPADFGALSALPGIGRSTAGAILAQAHGQRWPILDGNVRRLLSRWQGIEGWPGEAAVANALWSLAGRLLPQSRMADYTQAQMDLGATVCTRSRPRCNACPLRIDCVAHATGRVGELPTPRPRRVRPTRQAVLLWLEDADGRIAMQRRPGAGVWPGLWSLPDAADEAQARDWLNARFAADWSAAEALPPLRHQFTHFTLEARPLRLRIDPRPALRAADDPLRWTDPAEFANIGMPAPIRRLLHDHARARSCTQ
ncbi:MAG TPA: A/G-specific adenine glycosylase [Xanthomonadaceae bacterium]|nr:A/G-specific adenine glycosylase [Xanthomonadaceae bacterium]